MGGDTTIQSSPQPNYSESMRESLQAQVDLAPKLFAAEASEEYGRPAYAQLDTDVLKRTLLGEEQFVPDPGQEQTYTAMQEGGGGGGGMPSWEQMTYGQQKQFTDEIKGLAKLKGFSNPNAMSGLGGARKTAWENYVHTGSGGGPKVEPGEGLRDEIQTLVNLGYIEQKGMDTRQYDPATIAQAIKNFETNSGRELDASSWHKSGMADANVESAKHFYGQVSADRGGGGVTLTPDPVTGKMQYGGGLLDLIGGTGTSQFGTGVEQQFVTREATQADVDSGAASFLGQQVSEGRIRDGQMIGDTVDVMGTTDRRAGFDERGEFQGLAQYGSDIAEQSARRQRGADILDVQQFGGAATEALRQADPEAFGLRDTMMQGAQEDLAAGRGLSPRQRREAEQAARTGWEARGLVRDPEAVVSEVESVMDAAGLEEARRRAFATQMMGASQAMTADPFMAILGRPSGASQQIAQTGMGQAGYGLQSGPQMYSPESGLSYMMGQQTNAANLQAAQAMASATKKAGMMQGIGSALGCWIAREVYGETNPKWMRFREWMLSSAPTWFLFWYLINGERVAEWIKDKPSLKARIRLFMDSKLEA